MTLILITGSLILTLTLSLKDGYVHACEIILDPGAQEI